MRIIVETNICSPDCPDGVQIRELRIPDDRVRRCWTQPNPDALQDQIMTEVGAFVVEAMMDYDPR